MFIIEHVAGPCHATIGCQGSRQVLGDFSRICGDMPTVQSSNRRSENPARNIGSSTR